MDPDGSRRRTRRLRISFESRGRSGGQDAWALVTAAFIVGCGVLLYGLFQSHDVTWLAHHGSPPLSAAGGGCIAGGGSSRVSAPRIAQSGSAAAGGGTCNTSTVGRSAAMLPLQVPAGHATATGGVTAPADQTVQHIVLYMNENNTYQNVLGGGSTASSAYIKTLASTYGSATHFTACCHPSSPNHFEWASGQHFNLTTDVWPTDFTSAANNIFNQLPGGQSGAIQQSMGATNCRKADYGEYVVRHNPEAYFTDVAGAGGSAAPAGSDCALYDINWNVSTPNIAPKFTYATPDNCHGGHSNTCAGSSDLIKQTNDFMATAIPALMNTATYKAGHTVIFVSWDEGIGTNQTIPFLIIDPWSAHDTSACQGAAYSQASVIKYVEDTFGLPEIADAASAVSLAGCFGLP